MKSYQYIALHLPLRASCLLILTGLLCMVVSCRKLATDEATRVATNPVNTGLCGDLKIAATELLDALPAPDIREGIGNAHLTITTSSAEAQAWFDAGLNYLHGFWYLEAYRAFQQVIELDPDCAMGYWGVAMCQPGFGGDDYSIWQQLAGKADELKQACKAEEKALIQALQATVLYGLIASTNHWQTLVQRFSYEPDIIAVAAIMLRQAIQNQDQYHNVRQLVEIGLQTYPDHAGLLHFYVHMLEGTEDFLMAKPAAFKLIALAPAIPHLTHMPGHLYFLAGDYEAAAQIFEQAKRQEQAYHRAEDIPAAIDQNYMHNLHYLTISYTELGEREKALAAAEAFSSINLRLLEPASGSALVILYEGLILPARVHLRFGEFELAAKKIRFWLSTPALSLNNDTVLAYLEAMLTYCMGMAAVVNQGNAQHALIYANQMNDLMGHFAENLASLGQAERILAREVHQHLRVLHAGLIGWSTNIDPNEKFIAEPWEEALALERQLPYDEPPRLMRPVGESLMHLHRHRNEPAAASAAMQLALAERPKSPIILEAF
ncbi:MAG: hypothetical protein AAF433_20775 [Bacteroidota bacterium]